MHESLFVSKFDASKTSASLTSESSWQRIAKRLAEVLDKTEYSSWIAPLTTRVVGQKEITLLVPNMVFYQGLVENYWQVIEDAKSGLGIDVFLRIEIDGSPAVEDIKEEKTILDAGPLDMPLDAIKPVVSSRRPEGTLSQSLTQHKSHLNPNYTFSTFVSGESNRFAQAAAEAVANAPGQTYNPLFIYGGTGLGKTHLLHAVGNHIIQNNPSAIVTYISSERFMNEMIYCLRFNKMWDFRQKYRHCDVFLVDDIQFISGKERTQEEFFHTFNSLYEAKKQIVMTSDLFPQDIPDIEDRLQNRFQWGLIADIQVPDQEHRMAILFEKAQAMGIAIGNDVAEYIASYAKRNVRELEGALHRIAAFASLQGRTIDLTLAMETFQNILTEPVKRLTVEAVQKTVAEHFKIRMSDLKSKRRLRALTTPRQIAMYLARDLTNASFPEIGEKFGGKDHTTVMHAVKKITKERNDINLKTDLEALERKLEQLC